LGSKNGKKKKNQRGWSGKCRVGVRQGSRMKSWNGDIKGKKSQKKADWSLSNYRKKLG